MITPLPNMQCLVQSAFIQNALSPFLLKLYKKFTASYFALKTNLIKKFRDIHNEVSFIQREEVGCDSASFSMMDEKD